VNRASARATHLETADEEVALGDRVGALVGALEDRLDQYAAGQAARIADRRDGHVDLGARLGKRRQRRGHRDRGHVAQAQLLRVDLHPQAPQHREDRLLRERNGEVVARAGEAGHDSEADELVVARARHVGEVAEPLGPRVRRPNEERG
jgi:hypothetical protein